MWDTWINCKPRLQFFHVSHIREITLINYHSAVIPLSFCCHSAVCICSVLTIFFQVLIILGMYNFVLIINGLGKWDGGIFNEETGPAQERSSHQDSKLLAPLMQWYICFPPGWFGGRDQVYYPLPKRPIKYRTLAIISRDLYIFYPIFQCSLCIIKSD